MSNHLIDLLKTAKNRIDGGQYAEALQVLESALGYATEPWLEIEIHFQAALCRYELGEYAGAAENLETALSIAEDMAHTEKKHIYDLLRLAYVNKPDYIKLAGLCRTLLNVEEDKTGLMSDLLNVYVVLDKWDEMARVLDEFSHIDLDADAVLTRIR